jgi:hypothetical protein
MCTLYLKGFYMLVVRWDVLCPSILPSTQGHVSYFFAIFAATALKLGLLLCSKELVSEFTLQCN